jgi:predicted GIY-YIG superfamily endonuclease
VRDYFIAVEKTLLRYRADVAQAMEGRIKQLEASQRPLDAETLKTGVIYVIRAAEGVSLHKIGRTKDLAARLRSHSSARADRLEVLFVYKTDAPDRVEACVKGILKGHQYRKYKEVYEADLDTIKKAIDGCGELCTKVQRSSKRAGATTGGGGPQKTFMAFMS